jgi:hypothetical protein
MKLIIDQYAVMDSQLLASAALLAYNYAAQQGNVNGLVGGESGPLPGFLVMGTAVARTVDLAIGTTIAIGLLGLIASDYVLPASKPTYNGMTWKEDGVANISVVYWKEFRGTIQAYASKTEAGATNTYAAGDKLYRSKKWGVITKDTAGGTELTGWVLAVNTDGTIDVVLI